MSIRSIVTMGYSNGTFSIGTKFIPTLGYLISSVVSIDGPGMMVEGQIFSPNFKSGQIFNPGLTQGQEFNPGFKEGEAAG